MGEAFPIRQEAVLSHMPAQIAANWARAGFPVFPCKPIDKSPFTAHGFEDATADLSKVAAFWRAHPEALVGIPTGAESGLFVLDIDTDRDTGEKIGEESLAALGLSWLIENVPTVATPSGGLHLYFRDGGLGCTVNKIGRKIDTRGDGGYIVAPGSVTPLGAYRLLNGSITPDALTSVPAAIMESLQGKKAGTPTASLQIDTGDRYAAIGHRQKANLSEVEEILSFIPPDSSYDDWCGVLMGLHDHFGGSAAGLDIADRWSTQGAKYKLGEPAAKWNGFKAGGGKGWGSVCELARQNGADLADIARSHNGRQTTPKSRAAPSTGGSNEAAPTGIKPRRSDRPKWCADVACTILENAAEWRCVLAHDEFTGLDMLLQPIPGTTVPRSTFTPRPLTDNDITAAVRWFNRNDFPDATKNGTADAIFLVARHRIISPVRHFLESLTWDGVPRVAGWLTRYCGAERTDLTSKVGQAWLVSAVARALKPGCKADCALVLEGSQGAGKSSVLRTLAGDKWFYDGLRDMHSKDASAGLRGKWIIELPELSAMRRSDTEGVKAFLSRTEERYRPAYARTEVVEPRRCVFAGTTNRTDYLTDDTGGRRFWPVAVGAVDLEALRRDRAQLWAETVALFRAGEKWWLDQVDENAAAAVVSTRAADDPWTADVLRIVDGLTEVSSREVFQMLDIPLDRQTKSDAMRIAGILTRAGWSCIGKFTAGPNRGLSRYVAPIGGQHD